MFVSLIYNWVYLFTQVEKIKHTLIVSTVVILLFAIILIVAILKYRHKQQDYDERERLIETELIKASLEAKEQVIEDIADQVHIDIQQHLSLAKIHLGQAISENNHKKLKAVKESLEKGIQEVKALSRSIDPKMITGHTLEDNISRQLEMIKRKSTIQTVFNTSETEIELDENRQILLYRITQEAINNSIAHAKATEITIDLKNENIAFSLCIQDNGCGFDVANLSKNGLGLGLRSIYRRTELMKGSCTINSQPKKGTRLHIRIPYEH